MKKLFQKYELRFVFIVCFITTLAILDWHDQVYCKDVVVPTKCSIYQYPWE